MLLKKVRKSTLYVIPSQLLLKAIAMVYVVILARWLSIEEYGVYNLIFGTAIIFGYFCNFGLASSLQRFLAEYSQLKQAVRIVQTMLLSHAFRLALSILILGAGYYWFDVWAGFFNIEGRENEFLYFSLGAVLLFQIEFFQTEFNALFLHGPISIILVVFTIVKFLVVVGLLYSGYELSGVFFGEAAGYLVGFILCIYIFYKYVYTEVRREVFSGVQVEFRRIARYSAYNALVAPGAILYSHTMDYFVVAAMANPYQLGLYALASRASKMIVSIMPHKLLQSIIRPAFYHQYSAVSDQRAELDKMFNSLVTIIASSVIPALVCAAILSSHIITVVFGDKYLGSSGMMIILLLFSLFIVIEMPSDLVLQSIEKVQAQMYAQVFAVYNVVAAIILMKFYGVTGVAYATGSALMFKCLFLYFMVYRYTGIKPRLWPVIKVSVNTAITGGVVYLISMRSVDAYAFILSGLAGVAVYAALFFVNNPLGSYEKAKLNQYVGKKLF